MRRVLTLSVTVAVFVLLVAGAGGAAAADAPVAETAAECETEADNELVGCWNGVYHAETLDIDQEDGLTERELETLTHRSMARVEYLRERPFETDVPVETVSREQFQSDGTGNASGQNRTEFQRWNDQVWKALFVVGEDDSAARAIDTVFGGSVSGFYSPADDRIVLVVGENETLRVSESTLVHELDHAMQDQYHDLTGSEYVGATQDADLAVDGIVEGEAVYIEERYVDRCGANWSCLDEPESTGSADRPDFNFGILQTILQPYSDGPFYVETLLDDGGWDAVNATMNDPPSSTAEVIHRDPGYETREIAFDDTAEGGWETYADQGMNGSETAGEASMFVMFWYQAFEYEAATLEPTREASVNAHLDTDDELETRAAYNYAHPATAGWAGDRLYPYRNDTNGTERDGYVWVTEWQTPQDAAEFEETYLTMLASHDPVRRDDGVRDVATGDFRGSYGIERNGTRVTIVHAPEPTGVFELRPGLDLEPPATTDTEANTTDAEEPDGESDTNQTTAADNGSETPDTDDAESTTAGSDDESTAAETPGLGVLSAVVALLAATALLARRRRP